MTPNPPNDPLSLQLADFTKDYNTSTVSAVVAAQQDRGYKYANLLLLCRQAWLTVMDRFYDGDQRKADGTAVSSGIDGDAHPKLYLELDEGKTQGPWQQKFVGYGIQGLLRCLTFAVCTPPCDQCRTP